MMFQRNRFFLEILNGIIFGLTLLGASLVEVLGLTLDITTKLLIVLVLAIAYYYIATRKKFERVHFFKNEESWGFVRFFKRWYSKPGTLRIFSRTLEWLETPKIKRNFFSDLLKRLGQPAKRDIVEELLKKGQHLHLYLEEIDSPVVDQLRKKNVNIYQKRQGVRTIHRFSILEQDGVDFVIIRKKVEGEDGISFIETDNSRDPYVLSLARDMLEETHARVP